MLHLSLHDILICREVLWLWISILQFWFYPLRRLPEKSCSPGGLTPLCDSWRVPHNGSGGQLFLWELASAERKLHILCGGMGGRGGLTPWLKIGSWHSVPFLARSWLLVWVPPVISLLRFYCLCLLCLCVPLFSVPGNILCLEIAHFQTHRTAGSGLNPSLWVSLL